MVSDAGEVKDIATAVNEVFDQLTELDSLWSESGPSGDIFKLNSNAGGSAYKVDKRTYSLLNRGIILQELTDGAFNQLLGPVTDLWGFHSGNPHLPNQWEIAQSLPLVKGNLIFTDNDCIISEKGMKIDIGGIGKGYSVDLAVENLISRGMKSGIIEAGGDLRTFGNPPDSDNWRIGIRHPRNLEEFYGVLEIGEGSVATSGDYQQFFESNGKRYHHIIDPKTGYPAKSCVSATVLTKTCLDADAVATAVFVMGPDKGIEWLDRFDEFEGLIIYYENNGELTHNISRGLNFDPETSIITLNSLYNSGE